jgi:hypothetical protein
MIDITRGSIEEKIFFLRGVHIILDRNLAEFYGVIPTRLREQMKRNQNRFPEDFVFQLNSEEVFLLVSQNAIPSSQVLGGHLPYAFTEQGVAAVSAVIKNDRAAFISTQIFRAFVAMRRHILGQNNFEYRLTHIEKKFIETDKKLDVLFDNMHKQENPPAKGIFYDGQIFDAHLFLSKLVRSAKKSIILVDNYIDDRTFHLFEKRNTGVIVKFYTSKITPQLHLDNEKFNSQYPKIEVMNFKKSHDRFLVLDGRELYHFGASLKDLGNKWFAFSRMDCFCQQFMIELEKGNISSR